MFSHFAVKHNNFSVHYSIVSQYCSRPRTTTQMLLLPDTLGNGDIGLYCIQNTCKQDQHTSMTHR